LPTPPQGSCALDPGGALPEPYRVTWLRQGRFSGREYLLLPCSHYAGAVRRVPVGDLHTLVDRPDRQVRLRYRTGVISDRHWLVALATRIATEDDHIGHRHPLPAVQMQHALGLRSTRAWRCAMGRR